jgi:hypothetical protein
MTAKLLLALASTVILGSESHGIHDRNLLSDGSGNFIYNTTGKIDCCYVRIVMLPTLVRVFDWSYSGSNMFAYEVKTHIIKYASHLFLFKTQWSL